MRIPKRSHHSIPVGGHRRLELRVEAGNILNHPVFGNPATGLQSGTFGQILGIPGGGGTINANASYVERQIRLGVRFSFLFARLRFGR